MASLYIKDAEANALAEQLARRRGLTKTAAVKLALRRELAEGGYDAGASPAQHRPLRERLAELRAHDPWPPATGLKADKAFFDELSGDL